MKARTRFKEIYNFAFYYGRGNLEQLAQFQAVIVEPSAMGVADVTFLRARNTLVIAYLSAMEIAPTNATVQLLQADDFIMQNGHFVMQETYGNYLLNLNSIRWRGILYQKAGRLLVQQGYDGLFIDTIGDVEDPRLPNPSLHLRGAVEIVKDLRAKFPAAILIQNNGLELVCDYTAPFLDGLVWENAPLDLPESKAWVEKINEKINQLRTQSSFRIMLLFEDAERMHRIVWAKRRRFADTNEYLIYTGMRHYLGEVNLENR